MERRQRAAEARGDGHVLWKLGSRTICRRCGLEATDGAKLHGLRYARCKGTARGRLLAESGNDPLIVREHFWFERKALRDRGAFPLNPAADPCSDHGSGGDTSDDDDEDAVDVPLRGEGLHQVPGLALPHQPLPPHRHHQIDPPYHPSPPSSTSAAALVPASGAAAAAVHGPPRRASLHDDGAATDGDVQSQLRPPPSPPGQTTAEHAVAALRLP